MKALVTFLLVILLVACPLLCRAEPSGCCVGQPEQSGRPDDDSRTPLAPDIEPVSCVCAGAVKDSDQLSPPGEASHRFAQFSPFHIACLPVLSPLVQSIEDGAPPGGVPAGPHRLHLMLGTFRC